MRKSLLLITALFFIFSCEKDKDEKNQDEILNGNMINSISHSSVRVWDYDQTFQIDVPIPEDSIVTFSLDINKDEQDDFMLTVSHNSFEPDNNCVHLSVAYRYDIRIEGISEADMIYSVDQSELISYFSEGEIVGAEDSWVSEGFLVMRNLCSALHFGIDNEYIGIMHNDQIGWIKIEETQNNGVAILNYAINQTENNTILAGQTE